MQTCGKLTMTVCLNSAPKVKNKCQKILKPQPNPLHRETQTHRHTTETLQVWFIVVNARYFSEHYSAHRFSFLRAVSGLAFFFFSPSDTTELHFSCCRTDLAMQQTVYFFSQKDVPYIWMIVLSVAASDTVAINHILSAQMA